MTCKKLKLDPKSRTHLSAWALVFFVLALSYCLLVYQCYDTGIAISQGFITLWAGVKEKQRHGITLQIHVSNTSSRHPVPWKPQMGISTTGYLTGMTFSVCLSFPWGGAFHRPGHLVLLCFANLDWLIEKVSRGAEQWLKKPVSLEAVWYLNCCCPILGTGN